jgi:nicotinate-nucleotide adenylyltransferase
MYSSAFCLLHSAFSMRLGLLGGSFDPVHYGHLLLAECCRQQCRLDAVWFVPAAVPPHKQDRTLSTAADRIEMLKLAIGGHEAFSVWPGEIERGGVSYTVDTLQQLHDEQPQRELFFLMGADSLADLPTWREPRRICELAIPIIVRRVGSPQPDDTVLAKMMSAARLEMARQNRVEMPTVDLSSSDLRRRVAAGQSIRYRTPRAVEKYIQTQGLYR